VDLRVGRVVQAERVPKSDKLLRLQVDLGEAGGPRQVVAGIGQSYAPEALVGKSVVIVANLAPARIMGVESRGMLLAAGPGGADIVVAELAGRAELPKPGTRVK
jgi:methionyl-tRNA synthetase